MGSSVKSRGAANTQSKIDRAIYLAYSVKTSQPKKLHDYLNRAAEEVGRPIGEEARRLLASHLSFGTHPLDYIYLRLFRAPLSAGDAFVNTWEMHAFHEKFNHRGARSVLRDKSAFRERMSPLTAGGFIHIGDHDVYEWLRSRSGARFVAKHPKGAAGRAVTVHRVESTDSGLYIDERPAAEILRRLRRSGQILLEDYLEQHSVLSSIYPDSLNTVRVITFLNRLGEPELWAALLRVGNGGEVDNFDAGGLTAQVSLETGEVQGPVILKNPFDASPTDDHPITRAPIVGVKLPFWHEGLDLVRRAARANPELRTVGWDLALLEQGPAILEGNDNWDKTHYQLGA